MPLDLTVTRKRFPAIDHAQYPFFENAGGSQALGLVIDSMTDYLTKTNTQILAYHPASDVSTNIFTSGVEAAARFIGSSPENVVIGPSTTQLLANLSIALDPPEGAELVLSMVDHEANLAPWVRLAERRNLTIRWWKPADLEHPAMTAESLEGLVNERTWLVAVTHCSNILGVINPIADIVRTVKEKTGGRGMVCVDGVAMTAHRRIDVEALGVDFYVWSWYKTFGPHISTLYAAPTANAKVRSLGHYFNPSTTISQKLGLAGAAYELVAPLPRVVEYLHDTPGLWDDIAEHEEALLKPLLSYLTSEPKITVYGEKSASKDVRVPVVCFSMNGITVEKVRDRMVNEGYGLRAGHCYAHRCVSQVLGRGEEGVVRISFVHYNTVEEVESFVSALKKVVDADDW